MTTKIVARLKTGRVKNVVPYGTEQLPNPPYLVVKEEEDALGRGTIYRVIGHFKPGQQIDLTDYMRSDVDDLLNGFKARDRHGNYNILLTEANIPFIVTDNDDKTISSERVFLLPSRIF